MRPAGEARFGVMALLALQLMTSVGGVALLARMAPAVEHILEENVYSTDAVESMLGALVLHDAPAYQQALERARNNITEAEEVALIEALAQEGPDALQGREQAVEKAVGELRRLGDVNRASMRRADEEARVLGLAGAWAMVMLGFVGFLVSLVVYRRVLARLIDPIAEIDEVLAQVRAGDELRRCSGPIVSQRASRLAENLNWLLDRRPGTAGADGEIQHLRASVLVAVLNRLDRPAWVIDAKGRTVAANRQALSSQGASPWTTRPAVDGSDLPEGWEVTPVSTGLLVEGLDTRT